MYQTLTEQPQFNPATGEYEFTEGLSKWTDQAETLYVQSFQDGGQVELPVKSFTQIKDMFKPSTHIITFGKNRKGKTTLQLQIAVLLMNLGYNIIHRDDGGLEVLYLAPYITDILKKPYNLYLPEGCKFQPKNFHINKIFFDPFRQDKLVAKLLKAKGFNVILFDAFTIFGKPTAMFWSGWFEQLIFQLQHIEFDKKERIVLDFDEANDIVQPKEHSLSRYHQKTRGAIEVSVRKLAKHKLKCNWTSHRPNQLPLNVRSQFHIYLFKKSFPQDAYSMLNQMMAHVGGKTFWWIMKQISHYIKINQFFLFDDEGGFDRFTIEDIPRPPIKFRIAGSVQELYMKEERGEKPFDEWDMEIYRLRLLDAKKWTFRKIAKKLGSKRSTVYDRYRKILDYDLLAHAIAEAA